MHITLFNVTSTPFATSSSASSVNPERRTEFRREYCSSSSCWSSMASTFFCRVSIRASLLASSERNECRPYLLLQPCELLGHPHSRPRLYGNVLIAEGMQEQLHKLVRFLGCDTDRVKVTAKPSGRRSGSGAIPFCAARGHYRPAKIKLTIRSQCQ